MKFWVALILTALLSFISGLYLPWWGMAFVAFAVAILVHQKAGKAFLSGFAGLFLLWVLLAWWIDKANGGNLSYRIAQLLQVNSRFLLVLITGFVAGIVGGFAAMSGSYLRSSKKGVENEFPEETA